MKLLLVDDEEYVIESIKRNLDLTETGVSEVKASVLEAALDGASAVPLQIMEKCAKVWRRSWILG